MTHEDFTIHCDKFIYVDVNGGTHSNPTFFRIKWEDHGMENEELIKVDMAPVITSKNTTLEVQDASVTLCITFGDQPQSSKEE